MSWLLSPSPTSSLPPHQQHPPFQQCQARLAFPQPKRMLNPLLRFLPLWWPLWLGLALVSLWSFPGRTVELRTSLYCRVLRAYIYSGKFYLAVLAYWWRASKTYIWLIQGQRLFSGSLSTQMSGWHWVLSEHMNEDFHKGQNPSVSEATGGYNWIDCWVEGVFLIKCCN